MLPLVVEKGDTDAVVEVTKSMSQVVLSRKQHFERVAGEVTERRPNLTLITGYIQYLCLQLRKRCQPHHHHHQHHHH